MAVYLCQRAYAAITHQSMPPVANARREMRECTDRQSVVAESAKVGFQATVAARQSAERVTHQPRRQVEEVKVEQAPEEVQKSEEVFLAEIYIWDPDGAEGNCGHAGMALKRGSADSQVEDEYFSVWPDRNNYVLNNPLFLLFGGVPAEVHSCRKECEVREGEEGPAVPTRTITVKVTQTQYGKMQTAMAKLRKKISKGTIYYSLNTEMNPAKAFAKFVPQGYLSRMLSGNDHIDPLPDMGRTEKKMDKFSLEHCTTSVAEVLGSAGIDVPKRNFLFYGLSPDQLGGDLKGLLAQGPQIQQIKPK